MSDMAWYFSSMDKCILITFVCSFTWKATPKQIPRMNNSHPIKCAMVLIFRLSFKAFYFRREDLAPYWFSAAIAFASKTCSFCITGSYIFTCISWAAFYAIRSWFSLQIHSKNITLQLCLFSSPAFDIWWTLKCNSRAIQYQWFGIISLQASMQCHQLSSKVFHIS